MKKTISIFLLISLVCALFTITTFAVGPEHEVARNVVYKAAYGTPVVDGVMDDIYLQSDAMYAENVSFIKDASVSEGVTATAEYRIVWNKTTLFIFCTVTDPTKSDAPSVVTASATKMDNVDIYVRLDPDFSIDGTYTDRQNHKGSGQFRYNPNCTIEEEPNRLASWGALTVINQMSGTFNYKGGYINDTDGSYSFEMSFNYSSEFKSTVKSNIATRTETAIGFGIQINDVMDNDGKRDAMIFSNNAQSGLSSDLKNCGKVMLAYQDGVEIEAGESVTPNTDNNNEDTTPTVEDTTATVEDTTATVEDTKVTEDTSKVTTTENNTSSESKATEEKSGCKGNIGSSFAAIILLITLGTGITVCQKKRKY